MLLFMYKVHIGHECGCFKKSEYKSEKSFENQQYTHFIEIVMFETLVNNKRIFAACSCALFIFTGVVSQPGLSPTTDPEAPLPSIYAANEELLDQIFEEEKSNRICRFIKNRKMKA